MSRLMWFPQIAISPSSARSVVTVIGPLSPNAKRADSGTKSGIGQAPLVAPIARAALGSVGQNNVTKAKCPAGGASAAGNLAPALSGMAMNGVVALSRTCPEASMRSTRAGDCKAQASDELSATQKAPAQLPTAPCLPLN